MTAYVGSGMIGALAFKTYLPFSIATALAVSVMMHGLAGRRSKRRVVMDVGRYEGGRELGYGRDREREFESGEEKV